MKLKCEKCHYECEIDPDEWMGVYHGRCGGVMIIQHEN